MYQQGGSVSQRNSSSNKSQRYKEDDEELAHEIGLSNFNQKKLSFSPVRASSHQKPPHAQLQLQPVQTQQSLFTQNKLEDQVSFANQDFSNLQIMDDSKDIECNRDRSESEKSTKTAPRDKPEERAERATSVLDQLKQHIYAPKEEEPMSIDNKSIFKLNTDFLLSSLKKNEGEGFDQQFLKFQKNLHLNKENQDSINIPSIKDFTRNEKRDTKNALKDSQNNFKMPTINYRQDQIDSDSEEVSPLPSD